MIRLENSKKGFVVRVVARNGKELYRSRSVAERKSAMKNIDALRKAVSLGVKDCTAK